jgi:multimeric flavodoxin WrbA
MKKILICNGSLGSSEGNTHELIKFVEKEIASHGYEYELVQLKDLLEKKISLDEIKNKLNSASGFIFSSGTYWDSWGSPMQNFLEVITPFEGSDIFMGKPAAVFITMHSVGGKEVLSRLQGVLNTMGLLIPPMSGMVYSLSGQLALESKSSFSDDFWSIEDSSIVIHNLITSLENKKTYRPWPVDHKDPKRVWANANTKGQA